MLLPTLIFFSSISLFTKLKPSPLGKLKFSEWNKYPSAATEIP